ncbi:bifunctional serine/threonine protein kinase/MFS transporter [Streptomyces sp. NPDC050145]|uniref:bifunctional serine/threonine protein kinase/MFS transporter n=1 Tax=Streptomyces sp. NPDC050145 TaxID=3365602 RepID=UPI00378DC6A7
MDQLITSDPTHMGPYRLIGRLGEGGMGLVYLGRSEAGRTVAVKVVQAEFAANPEFRRRFAREVAAARRVGGAWTADVLDADTDAALPWVATQYIPGPDLTTVVGKDFGPLPEDSVRVLAHRLAAALQAVHDAGLIHRDLKPSNVLVTVDGPRVIDFGIARALDTLTGDSLHTRTGMLIGSPGFMSPEQVRGLELTPASDVFCLGAVLVHAATGRLLFGAGESGLNAHLFRVAEEEPDLTGVPASLVDLVRACLSKDPATRPSLREIADATVPAGDGEWLPGPVLAQLGRHAAQLLDYAPATPPQAPVPTRVDPAPSVPGQFGAPPAPASVPASVPSTPPPPAYAPTVAAGPSVPHPRRWWGLAVLALVQLLVLGGQVATAVGSNAASDLGLAADTEQWLFLGSDLAFTGLLLLGGHLADLVGRGRVLVIGLTGFALASAVSGAAADGTMLLAAHILQGACAGLVSPAALALVSVNFPEPKARGRAFGVYATVAGGGTLLGYLYSAALTQYASWRLFFYCGALLAVLALLGTAKLVHDRPRRTVPRFDLPGVLLGCGAVTALEYGLWNALAPSDDSPVLLPLLGGGALLLAFVWRQVKAADPLIPAYVLTDRGRLTALAGLLLAGLATSFLPGLMTWRSIALSPSSSGYDPMDIALAVLPVPVAALLGATQISARLLHRVAPRILAASGLTLAAAGLVILALLDAMNSHPGRTALPATIVMGLGLGLALVPLYAVATDGVETADAGGGAAAAVTLATLGASLGWTVFTAVRASTLAAHLEDSLSSSSSDPAVLSQVKEGVIPTVSSLPAAIRPAVTSAIQAGLEQSVLWLAALTFLGALLTGFLLRPARPRPVPAAPPQPLAGVSYPPHPYA